jgi:hypothetical protein
VAKQEADFSDRIHSVEHLGKVQQLALDLLKQIASHCGSVQAAPFDAVTALSIVTMTLARNIGMEQAKYAEMQLDVIANFYEATSIGLTIGRDPKRPHS